MTQTLTLITVKTRTGAELHAASETGCLTECGRYLRGTARSYKVSNGTKPVTCLSCLDSLERYNHKETEN